MQSIILSLLLLSAPISLFGKSLPLETLNLPAGFRIEIYARVPEARQMALGSQGTLFVGSRRSGKVHAVIDHNGDYKADEVKVIATKLSLPSGVAFRGGDLFVGAVNRILRYPNIETTLDKPPKPVVVTDKLPDKNHHGWKFLRFGPDSLLYFAVGAPCNICLSSNPQFASILRMDVDSTDAPEIIARGVRNTVGFDWHPLTKQLWFTDNGRDSLGDTSPPCELNRIKQTGQHFGYPYYHGESLPDPKFGKKGGPASDYVEPELSLDPHVAPLGMMFYTGNMFPESFRNQIIIPEHGSWNRSQKAGHTGYRLTIGWKTDEEMHYRVFIDGWLTSDNKSWGRPVHLLQLADGSLLLSDDKAGAIYRITYNWLISES
ncbi:MAG: PQQ-dependent sugar dehydrogenase [bacterium]